MLTAFLHMVLARDNAPLLPLLDAFTTDDLLARLPTVQVPTVTVCGLADHTTPPRDSRRMAAAIPASRTIWVEGAGHMLPWRPPTSSAAPSPPSGTQNPHRPPPSEDAAVHPAEPPKSIER